MTKFEMQQHLTELSTECAALRAELSASRAEVARLQSQSSSPTLSGRDSFKAQLGALRAAGQGAKLVGGKLVVQS